MNKNCDWNLKKKKKREKKIKSNYGSAKWQFSWKQSDEYEENDAKTAPEIQVCVNKTQ